VVGTPYALDGTLASAGGVVIFRRPSQAKPFVLEASLSPPSSYAVSAHDSYGMAVATLSDDVFAVSSRSGGGQNGGGTVFVYRRFVSSNVTATVVAWTLIQSLSCGSVEVGGGLGSGIGSVLAVGAPYYQTDYVPWPFVTTLYSGTAEVYVMVSLEDDFEGYSDGAWLTVGDGKTLGSLWSVVSYGVIRHSGRVGWCDVTSSVLSFVSGASGSQVLTKPLFVPNGGSLTMSLQYCSDPPEDDCSSDVTAMLVRWESGTVLSVLRLFDFVSFNGSMTTVTIPVCIVLKLKLNVLW
jgi:hypothetical protein